jgi:hypothetical protein
MQGQQNPIVKIPDVGKFSCHIIPRLREPPLREVVDGGRGIVCEAEIGNRANAERIGADSLSDTWTPGHALLD